MLPKNKDVRLRLHAIAIYLSHYFFKQSKKDERQIYKAPIGRSKATEAQILSTDKHSVPSHKTHQDSCDHRQKDHLFVLVKKF